MTKIKKMPENELIPTDRERIELRSDDVQEILGTPPGWLVRWGTMVVLFGFVMMLLAGWFIRYPDVINADVMLTTTAPPVEVVARTDGHVTRLFVRDTQMVRRDSVLAVIQSTAKYADIQWLDKALSEWQAMGLDELQLLDAPRTLNLGELQPEYSNFVQNLENFQFGAIDKNASVSSNIGSINQQIARLRTSIEYDEKSKARIQRQLDNARDLFDRQEELYRNGLMSKSDFEKERQRVDDIERQYELLEDGIIRKQNEIINLRKSINEVAFGEKEDVASATVRLRQSLSNLRSGLDKWKQTYLLTAPIDGRVSLNAGFFSVQQYVKQGEQVMAIVPLESKEIIGRLALPINGSGKVVPGQKVIIKLFGYPYPEYGTLRGEVASKALVPKDNQYAILVTLPEGLRTSYNKTIPFEQRLQGKAEIVTEDKRFLQRITEQVFAGIR